MTGLLVFHPGLTLSLALAGLGLVGWVSLGTRLRRVLRALLILAPLSPLLALRALLVALVGLIDLATCHGPTTWAARVLFPTGGEHD